jgi:hypothetical protein
VAAIGGVWGGGGQRAGDGADDGVVEVSGPGWSQRQSRGTQRYNVGGRDKVSGGWCSAPEQSRRWWAGASPRAAEQSLRPHRHMVDSGWADAGLTQWRLTVAT